MRVDRTIASRYESGSAEEFVAFAPVQGGLKGASTLRQRLRLIVNLTCGSQTRELQTDLTGDLRISTRWTREDERRQGYIRFVPAVKIRPDMLCWRDTAQNRGDGEHPLDEI